MTTRTLSLRVFMIMALSVASFVVLAATGGKKSRTTYAKKAASSTYHNFSLRSGFEFRGSRILTQPAKSKQVQFNSLAMIKKNNITYNVPYKTNVKSNQSKSYNNVEIRVVNIRL